MELVWYIIIWKLSGILNKYMNEISIKKNIQSSIFMNYYKQTNNQSIKMVLFSYASGRI